jgi:hypothetical protein
MSLKFRPTGLDSRPDYTVYTGECEIGRLYQARGGSDSLRWIWSMNAKGPLALGPRGNPERG